MNVLSFTRYKQSKESKNAELRMLNSEMSGLLKLRSQVDFNISIMQEVINIVEEESCTKKDK
tara:strand:- start:10 stop:195 length:186 start_codon:yes stop_codon:yes gene_type:complete